MPDYLVTIYIVNDGPAWAIGTSRESDAGEHPIVEYFPGESEAPFKIIAPDFRISAAGGGAHGAIDTYRRPVAVETTPLGKIASAI